ncbi:hypothetical protein JCM10908_005770 [Rhodotorula pacifica]|uniref:uncharacterized protein n=1 Tax=Rhodotorula pacifica TaxID=1495444 RepID=UPI0031816947
MEEPGGPAMGDLPHTSLERSMDARSIFFYEILHANENSDEARHNCLALLSWIDAGLQWFTLGVSEEKPERPDVTDHSFRKLTKFEIVNGVNGEATVEEPLVIQLPAYPLQGADVQRMVNDISVQESILIRSTQVPLRMAD